ncbi:MAG: 30S ribosomal protein S1 [Alphaproteobacteria bacterium]|nr:30S ribosomal protein S1 [Alphaproteobacteria bacterium]
MSNTEFNTNSDFQNLLEAHFQKRMNLEGQVVKGKVVSIDKDMALIDVDLKSEGRVPLKEFLPEKLVVGDIVDVYIDRYEGPQGDVQLSHERARQEASWQYLSESFHSRKPIEGTIIGQVKGGLTVDIRGTIAFLPGSQVDIRPVKDLSNFLNVTDRFVVLKMDDLRSNVVVSRRAVLEDTRSSSRQELLAKLQQGDRLKGTVKNITDYGVFVDLGGIDGLLHITDISWTRIKHPSEILKLNDEIDVMVTRLNKESQRISLGMKQLEKDPWLNITERYKPGDKVQGEVSNVVEYGAFVRMDEGLEGLVHMGDMVWGKKTPNPHHVVKPEQRIETMILDIDTAKRRISLGIKQCTENLLERFAKAHPEGSEVEGEVQDITEFGLLVSLPGGLEGVVYQSDLSWDSNEQALSKYHVGSMVKMKVLSINLVKEMIGLGIKQLTSDPWMEKHGQFKKGQVVTATVLRTLDQGIEVNLGDGLQATIQRAELSRDRALQNTQRFSAGQEVQGKITAFNPETHYIALSIKAMELDEEKEALSEYKDREKSEGDSLGSLVKEAIDRENLHHQKTPSA